MFAMGGKKKRGISDFLKFSAYKDGNDFLTTSEWRQEEKEKEGHQDKCIFEKMKLAVFLKNAS